MPDDYHSCISKTFTINQYLLKMVLLITWNASIIDSKFGSNKTEI